MRRWGLKIRLRLDLLAGCDRFGKMKPVSCSMDPECVTPEYVCRMLGSTLASEDIAESLERAKTLLL